jgi:hypothetical protein
VSGGALLVAEMLLDEGGTSPPEVLLQSLNMLAQTHGRERRLSEYRTLLEEAGFKDVQGKKTGGYGCMLCGVCQDWTPAVAGDCMPVLTHTASACAQHV